MKLFATAAAGTEGVLRDELRAHRFRAVKADRGGVHFEGDLLEGARACLWSRVAMRVQAELGSFDARGEAGLYEGVRSLDWSPWVSPRHTIAVSATCKSSALTHSQYIALKTKDAIVDQVRDRTGARPDVDTQRPDVGVIVRLVNDKATVYLDLAGEPLHRRGYRAASREAVMKESLAAAVILLGGWSPEHPFVDPMCGAGTLPIEAALMARRIPPGAKRSFGVERSPAWGETERRAGVFIGPEFGTVSRPDLTAAAREATEARFDVLIACAFNFEAHASELIKLGPMPILKAKMNPDLHMAGELKNTGKGNLFIVFGEPDVEIERQADNQLRVRVKGVDVFDPNTGVIRSGDTKSIAAWFIDTDYDEESFFVRHAYFLGANDPYKSLKTALRAEIDEMAWATLYSDTSRPFERPTSGRIAVKVINHFGDEVMKVFRV